MKECNRHVHQNYLALPKAKFPPPYVVVRFLYTAVQVIHHKYNRN